MARNVNAVSPLIAPRSFRTWRLRHPERLAGEERLVHDAVPFVDLTVDRQILCGNTTRLSPTRIASSSTSSTTEPERRCAIDGMRRASACRTDEARPSAKASSAWPPDSINTTSARQVLAQDHGRDDGDAGKQVRAELPSRRFQGEPGDERRAAPASTT